MNNINGNITFFLEEKNSNKGSNDFEIQKMLSEFDEEYIPIVNEDMIYYIIPTNIQ